MIFTKLESGRLTTKCKLNGLKFADEMKLQRNNPQMGFIAVYVSGRKLKQNFSQRIPILLTNPV